jgi:hypothetical protein
MAITKMPIGNDRDKRIAETLNAAETSERSVTSAIHLGELGVLAVNPSM